MDPADQAIDVGNAATELARVGRNAEALAGYDAALGSLALPHFAALRFRRQRAQVLAQQSDYHAAIDELIAT